MIKSRRSPARSRHLVSRAAAGRQIKMRALLAELQESTEEAVVVDTVLPELRATESASEEFAAKAKVLKALVEHHADEEETQMFPRAKSLLGREKLLRLGERLAEQKASLTESVLTKLVELVRP